MVPTDVNVDVYVPKDQFYCSFRTDISLRSGEDIVFQYSREFPLYFPQSDWERVRANGLAIEDSFPVIEGRYKLSVLLTNTVGKQFSVLERDIEVPAEPARPSLNGPFLGYKFETYQRDVHIPFKSEDQKLVTDPKMTFARGEALAVLLNVVNPTRELLERGEMRIVVQGLREADPVRRSYTVKLSAFPLRKVLSVPQTIAAPDLDPDYYELRVALVGAGGETLDEKKESFVISPVASIGHPIANAKGFPLANQFLYRYMLAQQAERTGRAETAKSLYDQAFQLNPDYKEGVIMYATFLNKTGAFEEALQIAEKLRGDDQRRFPFSLIRGQALLGLERYEEALAELLQANRIYNSDTAVLNSLGRCYFGLGRKEEALEALRASLKLNPEQKAIRALIEEIEK